MHLTKKYIYFLQCNIGNILNYKISLFDSL